MRDERRIAPGPAVTIDGPTRFHVVARAAGGNVIVKSYEDGKGDEDWRDLGPVAPPPSPDATPGAPPPPAPPPAPVGGGQVQFDAGLGCTPRGQRMAISITVHKRPGRARPRVRKVVFFYRKGKRRIARTDSRAPYRRTLPIDLRPGIYRVYARISYKRPGKRRVALRTLSKRFAVCA